MSSSLVGRGWTVGETRRRGLSLLFAAAAALNGCNCGKKDGGGSIVGNTGDLQTASTINFGYVAVGQHAQQILKLDNDGAGELDISPQSITNDATNSFKETVALPPSVAPGGNATAQLQFEPTDAGPMTADLVIPSDGTVSTTTVTLTGVGLDIDVSATPASVDFGSVQVNPCPGPTTMVTFTNDGTQPAQLTFTGWLPDAGEPFVLSDSNNSPIVGTGSAVTLNGGGTYTVTVTYDPTSTGSSSSSFSYLACAAANECLQAQSIPVNGVGVNGQLCFVPDPIAFQNVGEGQSASQTVTVQNCGQNQVAVQCVYLDSQGNGTCNTGDAIFALGTFSPSGPTPSAPITLDAGDSFNFVLTYTATGLDGGDGDKLDADLLPTQGCITATAQDQIYGDQNVNPCTIAISPSTINFGNVTTQATVTAATTLTNTGSLACNLTNIAIASGSDPSYTLDPSTPTLLNIPAGGSAQLTVDFSLQMSGQPNIRKGTLDFDSNDPSLSMGQIPLVATLNATNPYATGWPKWHLDNNNSGQSTADTSSNVGTVVWKHSGLTSAASLTQNGNSTGWNTGDNGCAFTYLQGPVVADDPSNDGAYYVYQMDLSGTLWAFSEDGGVLWKTATSDPSTDPHPSTPAVIAGGNIWAVSGSDAYNQKSGEAHLNALFLLSSAGTILSQQPYGKDGFDACPGLGTDGTLFEADDNATKPDAGNSIPPPQYSDEFSVVAFTSAVNGASATVTLETGTFLPITTVSERFGVAIGDDNTSFWGVNGQFFAVSPPDGGFSPLASWPGAGVTLYNNTKDTNAVGPIFSDLALDPLNTGYVFAYAAWEDGVGIDGGYYADYHGQYGSTKAPYSVAGMIQALDMTTGATKWSANLPSAKLPGSTYTCADYGNAAPAVGKDGTVYVGNGDGLRAFDAATGNIKWFYPTANVTTAPAIGGDGTVFFGCADGTFYAINNNVLRYTIPAGAPIGASPAIADDGTVFFTSDDGTVWAVK